MGGAGAVEVRPSAVRAAIVATFAAFAVSGLAFASWAARIPQIRDQLALDPGTLGLVLLSVSAGSVTALPLAGTVVARFGSRRTVIAAAALFGAGMATVAAGTLAGVAPVVVGLVVLGVATAAWDVAMNVQGTVLERHLGRSMMSRFHAGFSVGTVLGALIGTVMVALRVPVFVHLLAVAVVALTVPVAAGRFVADRTPATRNRHAFTAWTERRTVLLGLFVLAFTFAEGAGMDWISLAAIDDHGTAAWAGTLAFAVFLAAMTAGRWFGTGLLDRYGRVRVVRTLTMTACIGTVLFVVAPAAPVAFAGALLWGLGISLGFPVAVSIAGEDSEHAAGRVSVISSIGYCAFLAGPPAIGFLGAHVTVLRALLAVAVVLAVAALGPP